MKKNRSDNADRQLSDLIKQTAAPAPKNPWFTDKVLNRLPPRRRKGNVIEKWIFLVTLVGVIAGLAVEATHIAHAQVIYIRDLMTMGAFVFAFLAMAVWIVAPLARN